MPSFNVNASSRLGCLLVGVALGAATYLAAPQPTAAASGDVRSVTIPSLPYPQSGLRQRLAAEGKSLPPVDVSLQDDIPGQYYAPTADDAVGNTQHPAVIALPDCDDSFPARWITILQQQGIGVLLISPNQAHPSQGYCTEGSLGNPKHGLTYWAFDAISALNYLAGIDGVDADRIAIFGYGYGAGAAQLAIYRKGHAKHFDHRFKALVGLRAQCMSEMDNFAPSLLIGVKDDPFNPPAWCHWRMDRDLRADRKPVRFVIVESSETIEKQATRKMLSVETSREIVVMVSDFLSQTGIIDKNVEN